MSDREMINLGTPAPWPWMQVIHAKEALFKANTEEEKRRVVAMLQRLEDELLQWGKDHKTFKASETAMANEMNERLNAVAQG